MILSRVSMVALLALLPTAALAADITTDSLKTVHDNVSQGKAIVVDVREKSEWDQGHVEGAHFVPLSALQANPAVAAKSLPKDKVIYTHCVVGKRSLAAANVLEKLGYKVRPLKPGYEELLSAGFKSSP